MFHRSFPLLHPWLQYLPPPPLFLGLLAPAQASPTRSLRHLFEWMVVNVHVKSRVWMYVCMYLSIFHRWQGKGWQRTGSKSWTGKEERGKKQNCFNTRAATAALLTSCSPRSHELHQPVTLLFCGSFGDLNSGFSDLSAVANKWRAVNRLEKPCTLQGLQFVIALVCLCLEINFTKRTRACFVCLCLLLPWHAFFPTVSAWSKLMHLYSYR